MAATIVVMLPTPALLFDGQRQLVSGLTRGALKSRERGRTRSHSFGTGRSFARNEEHAPCLSEVHMRTLPRCLLLLLAVSLLASNTLTAQTTSVPAAPQPAGFTKVTFWSGLTGSLGKVGPAKAALDDAARKSTFEPQEYSATIRK